MANQYNVVNAVKEVYRGSWGNVRQKATNMYEFLLGSRFCGKHSTCSTHIRCNNPTVSELEIKEIAHNYKVSKRQGHVI